MRTSRRFAKDDDSRRSLNASLRDGIFASVMNGFTAEYFTPFLLLLGAGVRQVGILNAAQNLAASFVQFKSADLTVAVRSRRKIFVLFVFLQVLTLAPMVFCALWKTPIWVFISLVVLFAACNGLATPAWSSLMSELVRPEVRGAYFGWRNKTLGLITVGATLAAGWLLSALNGFSPFTAFAFIFACAFIFRLISWYFLTRMHEPPLTHSKIHQFTLFQFVRRLKESNFAKFVLFVAAMNFSVNLASPFFAVLMIRDFHFSYPLYGAITATATLTVCLLAGRWGRYADHVGNIRILKLTSPLIGAIPLLWILNHHPAFLFFAQIFSGFMWAGFNLCASNFIYDAVIPEKRTRCIAYFNLFNGLALGVGGYLGGFLAPRLPVLFGYKLLTLLLISAILRMAIGLVMPRFIKEVRPVKPVQAKDLFLSFVGMRSLGYKI
ncbi:MAG: MFS transporter [Candidatus Omnitrophota bacterium]